MILKLLAFVFIGLLGLNSLEQKTDFADGSPPSVQRFDELWLITYVNDGGFETIAQARTSSGEIVPLIATNTTALRGITQAAKAIAQSHQIKLRLIKFTSRSEVGELTP